MGYIISFQLSKKIAACRPLNFLIHRGKIRSESIALGTLELSISYFFHEIMEHVSRHLVEADSHDFI